MSSATQTTQARDDAFWKQVAEATDLRRQLGEKFMQQALNELQQAQNALARACAALSPLMGASPEWKAVGVLHDRVKSTWYRVNTKRTYLRDRRSGPNADDINVAAELELRATKESPQ
jgi:hypothetical protein